VWQGFRIIACLNAPGESADTNQETAVSQRARKGGITEEC
jgi:hypothetical protein